MPSLYPYSPIVFKEAFFHLRQPALVSVAASSKLHTRTSTLWQNALLFLNIDQDVLKVPLSLPELYTDSFLTLGPLPI